MVVTFSGVDSRMREELGTKLETLGALLTAEGGRGAVTIECVDDVKPGQTPSHVIVQPLHVIFQPCHQGISSTGSGKKARGADESISASFARGADAAASSLIAERRTVKLMTGMLSGGWVVSTAWVEACIKAQSIVDEKRFVITKVGRQILFKPLYFCVGPSTSLNASYTAFILDPQQERYSRRGGSTCPCCCYWFGASRPICRFCKKSCW